MSEKNFEGGICSSMKTEIQEKKEKPDRYLRKLNDLKKELEEVETKLLDDPEKIMDLENRIFMLGHPEEEVTREENAMMTMEREAKERAKKLGDFTGLGPRYERLTKSEEIKHEKRCEELTKEITEDFLRAKDDFLKDRLEKTEKAEINPFDSRRQSREYKKRIMKLENEIFENGKEKGIDGSSEDFLREKDEFFEKRLKEVQTNPYDPIKQSKDFDKWKEDEKHIRHLNGFSFLAMGDYHFKEINGTFKETMKIMDRLVKKHNIPQEVLDEATKKTREEYDAIDRKYERRKKGGMGFLKNFLK